MNKPPLASPVKGLPVVVSFMVLLVALSGCAKKGDSDNGPPDPTPDGSTPPTGTRPPGPSIDTAGVRPLWYPGLQFVYAVDYPRPDVSGELILTVVRDEATGFQLTASGDEDVVMWSLFVHLPPVGLYTRDFEAPIHGAAVRIFDFPLSDGKTWSAPEYRGTTVNYTTVATETTLPDARIVPAFEVTGERNGLTWIHYVYTAEIGFFVTADIDGNSDGLADGTLTLTDARATTDHLTLATLEPVDLAGFNDQGPTTLTELPEDYTVPADVSDLYFFCLLAGLTGHYSCGITLPGGDTDAWNFTNTNQTFGVAVVGAHYPAEQGSGTIGSIVAGQGFVIGELIGVVRRAPGA